MNHETPAGGKFCVYCGIQTPRAAGFCPGCGAQTAAQAGAPVARREFRRSRANNWLGGVSGGLRAYVGMWIVVAADQPAMSVLGSVADGGSATATAGAVGVRRSL